MVQIPNDVIYSHILPRLPVKSLTRFKCVSKSWQTLISSSNFIRLHRRHALSSDANCLVLSGFYSFSHFVAYDLDSPFHKSLYYPYPEPKTSGARSTIVASCEFFVLVSIESFGNKPYELFVVNPSTHSYHKIPLRYKPNLCLGVAFGICLDETYDDEFKVITIERFINDQWGDSTKIMMYSSVTNSWRLIKLESTPAWGFNLSRNVVIINNLFYITLGNSTSRYIRIGCFDIQAEQWANDIPLPDTNLCDWNLRLLDGSLCLLGYDNNNSFQVWVMKDRWVKLMSTGNNYNLVGYCRVSRHELLCRPNHSFCRYNFKDKVAAHVALDCCVFRDNINQNDHVCRESLVTFPNKLKKVLPSEIYNSLQNKSTDQG